MGTEAKQEQAPEPDLGPDFDVLWGRERHPSSPARGRIVTPIIFLWDRPPYFSEIKVSDGGALWLTRGRRVVVAVAEHNTTCAIIDELERGPDGRPWFHVRPSRAEWVGRLRRFHGWLVQRRPSGWVSAPFLLARGQGWVGDIPLDEPLDLRTEG